MKSINALRFGLSAAAVALVLGLGANAKAQPSLGQPGSVLIFPLFDSRPASATLINVTNTNRILVPCAGDDSLATGSVNAHYVYQGSNQEDIDDGDAHWREFDRDELLTPNDTISVLASRHNPENEIGFLYVVAEDPDTRARRNFNFLIGSAYIANASLDLMWSYMPYSFKALRDDPSDTDTCGWPVASEDGRIHFDGVHYEKFPDELLLDSFIEELNGVSNELVLMSTSGAFFRNDVDLLFYNNREQPFSRTMRFVCWTAADLLDISGVAGSLNGDPAEFIVEMGWLRIDGDSVRDGAGRLVEDDPAMLGVFMQCVRQDFCAGTVLHYSGTQDNAVLD